MGVKLNTGLGGSITIDATNTASNVTATLPAVSGTVQVQNNMPAFSAYQSATQNISNVTVTKLTFDVEVFDTNNNFASSRFTPTVAGYYFINVCSAIGTTTTSHGLQVGIYKNGSQNVWGNVSNANSQIYPYASCSTILYLNGSTDYVEGYIYGSVGGTYSLLTGSSSVYFNGSLIRTA